MTRPSRTPTANGVVVGFTTSSVNACPVDALELTQDFELASYTRDGAIWDRQMLEEGPRPTQYRS